MKTKCKWNDNSNGDDLRDVLSSSNPGFDNLAIGYNESVGNTSISLRRTKDEAMRQTTENR